MQHAITELASGLLFPEGPVALADGWLDAHPDAPGALRRLVLEQRDHLARDLRAQLVNRP